jgi:integrase
MDTRTDAATSRPLRPDKKRAARKTEKLTKELLDPYTKRRPREQKVIWDDEETGLCVLISPGPKHKDEGTVTFRVCYYLRDDPGKPRYLKLGRYPDGTYTYTREGQAITIKCDAARASMKELRTAVLFIRCNAKDLGIDPRRPRLTGNFKQWVDRFIKEYAEPNQRSWSETKRILELYAVPDWQDRDIEQLEWKKDISPHLSKLATGKYRASNGKALGTPSVARSVRAHLVTLFNWYIDEYSSEKFRSPMVSTSKTKKWKVKARERNLDRDELRILWAACDQVGGPYPALVKTALLTGQRFRKVGQMQRRDLKERVTTMDGTVVRHVWDPTRPSDPENKQVGVVPLSKLARQVIESVPIIDADRGQDFVFTYNGRKPMKGWSKCKARLDRKMRALLAEEKGVDPATVEWKPWQARDLRRTTRTMLSRLVSKDIAEHCLAHVPPKIEGTYDRYDYLPEKRAAFERLATELDCIINPPRRSTRSRRSRAS